MPTDTPPSPKLRSLDEIPKPRHPAVWMAVPFVAAALILGAMWWLGGIR